MMIGRLALPEGSVGRGASFLPLSCVFKPVASDAAIAEPRNPRRLMDMNSPNSGNGEKDNMARRWRAGRPRPAEPAGCIQGRLATRAPCPTPPLVACAPLLRENRPTQ